MIWQCNRSALNVSGVGKLLITIYGNRNEITLPMIPVELAIQNFFLNVQGNRNTVTIPMVANGLDPHRILKIQGNRNTVNGVELMLEDLGAHNIYIGQPGQFIQTQGDYQNVGYIGGQYVINQHNAIFRGGNQNIQLANVYDAEAFNMGMGNVLDEEENAQVEELKVLSEHEVTIQGNRNVINVLVGGNDDGNAITQTSDVVQGNRNTIDISMKF